MYSDDLKSARVVTSVVPNYYIPSIGVTFYTALPQKLPTWQAVLLVFRLNVWLPLILMFGFVSLLIKKLEIFLRNGSYLLH